MALSGIARRAAPVLAVAVAACATGTSVQQQPIDAGIARSFNAPYDKTLAAALTSLTQMKFTPVEREDKPDGHSIVVGRPPHGFSWGEVGRIFVERSATPPTTVRVVYEKRFTLQFANSNFPRYFFDRMDQVLASEAAAPDAVSAAPATEIVR